MCGLVGIISRKGNVADLMHRDVDAFKLMLIMDTIRGEDSTGAFTVLKNSQVAGVKMADVPHNLFNQKPWNEFQSKAVGSGRFIVGHNRKATQGAVSPDNAHPFNEGAITLMHNGTLRNHRALANVDVDSHAVAKAFNEGNYKDVIKEIDGAFCFVWYDSRDKKLRILRNEERPMGIISTADRFIFSSEVWMASAAASRYGIIDTKDRPVIETVHNLKPGTICSFDAKGVLEVEEVELYKPKVYVYNAQNWKSESDYDVDDIGVWKGPLNSVKKTEVTEEDLPFTPNRRALLTTNVRKIVDVHGDPIDQIKDSDLGETSSPLDQYKIKEYVACVFTGARQQGQFVRLLGKTKMPGKPILDVSGTLPIGTDIADAMAYCGEILCSGRIVTMSSTVCGPTLNLGEISIDPILRTLNGMNLSDTQWYEVIEENACHVCGKYLEDDESEFSNVKMVNPEGGVTKYRCTCADCISSKIENPESKSAFIERRAAALQARIAEREASEHTVVGQVGTPSSASLH